MDIQGKARAIGRRGVRAISGLEPLREALRRGARAGLVPGGLWRRMPVETDFEIHFPDGISFRYASTAYDGIGRQLYWKGETFWEYETTSLFARLARRASLTLDVGANTGFYTLLAAAANPAGRVIAFEPVPRIFERLSENIELNGWDHRCDARPVAVSAAPGRTQLHVPDQDLPTSASLHAEGYRGQAGEQVEVEVTTLDRAVPEESRVDLIKIDVEGFEPEVLEGAERVLTRDRPLIVLECNPGGPAERLGALLKPRGYRFYHLLAGGPKPVEAIVPDPAVHHRNFLVAHESRESLLQEDLNTAHR